jgi:plasmid maintenance system killer protein
MKIKLNLSQHCIETETQRLYNQSVLKYFKADDKDRIEKQIEILQHALQTLDFGNLRSTYPELAGHCDDHAELSLNNQNQIIILINGKEI